MCLNIISTKTSESGHLILDLIRRCIDRSCSWSIKAAEKRGIEEDKPNTKKMR